MMRKAEQETPLAPFILTQYIKRNIFKYTLSADEEGHVVYLTTKRNLMYCFIVR